MESFERYAGFFPEAALSMIARQAGHLTEGERPAGHPPLASPAPRLPAGAWADAVLPDVVEDGAPRDRPADTRASAWWRRPAEAVARRLRAVLPRR